MQTSFKIVDDVPPCDICGRAGFVVRNVYSGERIVSREARCKAHVQPGFMPVRSSPAALGFEDLVSSKKKRSA